MGRIPRRLALVVAAAAVGLPACGTRLPDSAFMPAVSPVTAGVGASASATSSESAGSGVHAAPLQSGATGSPVSGQAITAAAPGAIGSVGPLSPSVTQPGQQNFTTDVGVTANSITIGNVTSLSGPFGPDTLGPTLYGLTAYVDALNDRGGVNGRKINLVTCDDGADGSVFLACAQKLVEQDHVFAFIGNNSDASAAGAHYEYTKGVPDVGLPLNNGYYKYPNMFSIYGSPGYPRDGKTVGYQGNLETPVGVYQWFKDNTHVTKAAVFYYVIPVSRQAGCFEEKGLAAVGVPTLYEGGGGSGNCVGAGENPAAPAFDEDVINMRSKGVDAVWDAMDVSANARLCQAMDRQGFSVKAKVSTVEVYNQTLGSTFSAPCRDSVYIGGSSTSFANSSNPLVQQFRADYARYQPGKVMHQWALEGWALGYEFDQAVSSMGANVTRGGLESWLDSFPPRPSGYTFGGLFTPVTYAPTSFSDPAPDCATVAQWSDTVQTFVQRAPTSYCPVVPSVATRVTSDGS